MGRRRMAVGETGTVQVIREGNRRHLARVRVRCRDGRLRNVRAYGTSKTDATDKVLARAATVALSAGRPLPSAGSSPLTPATTIAVLADKWMEQTEASGNVAAQSLPDYKRYVEIVKEGIGELLINEATPATLEWLIETEAADQPSKARNLRRTLRGMFTLAIRHNAYDRANPAAEVEVGKSRRSATRALTLDELKAYREAIRTWCASAPESKTGRKGGRPRTTDLLDIVDIQLATGARIGEVLALRWSDVDLEAEKPTAHICGTLVRLPGKTADGGGLVRQEHRKAKDTFTVFLPRFAVSTLMRIKMSAQSNAYDVIFPSSTGTLRSPENLRTQLRAARGETFSWVKPHTFRKTVATVVEREASLEAASKQLGHTSGTAVTAKHYVARSTVAPDLSEVLEILAPSRQN
ncbi:tyrosine-type recombinase/integrase [Gordonia sp. (in: high G+C Gram-positive bacteria)]|uniref:tyrosine-type recombinase/integrase n=1 Tax=Gordonia sp. (in: high G+C Gram-positive bacteria) TaxID=84139 RepID=UPI00333ED9F3